MVKQKNVMLTVTEKCNLNCTYCFEKEKSHRSMNFDTARNIIIEEMKEVNEYDEILFDFMGGEPFVEFGLIKKICEFVWSYKWPKKYLFFASTNGTLIKSDISEWLTRNSDKFICGLSLDGTREMHNKNRCNSFDEIDTDFFVKTWPLQEAKMTVSPETISQLFEGVRFIHDLGFRVKSNLAYGPDWGGKEVKKVYEEQLSKLIEYYTVHDELEPTTLVNMDLISVAYPQEPMRKWCGMGSQMIAYDINGVKYPCHFFQDLSLGLVRKDEIWNVDYSNIHKTQNNHCKHCILKNSCPTCYGYNFSKYRDFCSKDPAMCELKKMSATATATLQYRRFAEKHPDGLFDISNEEKERVKAIAMIQYAADSGNWNI